MPARHRTWLLSTALSLTFAATQAWALQRTWIGGNLDWFDGGSAANWTPADEPDLDDEAIFNTANAVNLGSSNAVNGLTLSGGIDLRTNGQGLLIDGVLSLSGAGTSLLVGGSSTLAYADRVTISNSAALRMADGALQVFDETGSGSITLSTGGSLSGYGTVTLSDILESVTPVFTNNGTISASRNSTLPFGAPTPDTLTISLNSSNARIDLDGLGNGVVTVGREQTLDINATLNDSFDGSINLFQNSKLDIATPWQLSGGTLTADNGLVDNPFPNPDVAAGPSTIAGGALTQTGGTIVVADADGVLQFDARFTMNGGTLTNNGLVYFNNDATIAAAANLVLNGGADLRVGVGRQVTINQSTIDLDGTVAGAVQFTVESNGVLTVDVVDYDTSTINAFDGVIALNSGAVNFFSADAETVMDGTLNMNFTTPGQVPTWTGKPLDIGDDLGTGDARVNVTGAGVSRIATQVDFNSDAKVQVAAGAVLSLTSNVVFSSAGSSSQAEFSGAGEISFGGQVAVLEATTLNMVGGVVDLDGDDQFGSAVGVDAPLVVNAKTLRAFGRTNVFGGINTIEVDNLSAGKQGSLAVNLDDPDASWVVNAPGVVNLKNDNASQTLLSGSAVTINGTLNVTGDVRTNARIQLGASGIVNILTAGEKFALDGGGLSLTNAINGGTISGPGAVALDVGRALVGHGTIDADVSFLNTGNRLTADNGTLTVSGAFVGVGGTIGTEDVDGVLNVVNPWNSNDALSVRLKGGQIRGGALTNDGLHGIRGHGLVASRIVNNAALRADVFDATLIVQTTLNDNDWDGAGAGSLLATEFRSVLELRDTGAAFGFAGTVTASGGGRVFANGFALDFNPGSSLNLEGGVYEATGSTDLGGTVAVTAFGDSRIKVANGSSLTFQAGSSTTLGAGLVLENDRIRVQAGAVFSGTESLVVDVPSSAVLDNGAVVNVAVVNAGILRTGGVDLLGFATTKGLRQASTGTLELEIAGAAPGQYDRLQVSGVAQLAGRLLVDLDAGFDPGLGSSFDLLTASAASGTFGVVDFAELPAGKAFRVDYLPTVVRLTVVERPGFSADFDDDGDVDATDLGIWTGALGLTGLGDADGDRDSDGVDLLLWQQQVGSRPSAVAVAAAVPEPGAAALVLLAAGALSRRRGEDLRRRTASATTRATVD